MINQIVALVKNAGNKILEIYADGEFETKIKDDNSPLTKADLVSNDVIIDGLKRITDYPILSEESVVGYTDRKDWNIFWLVDPLDGTKDFIAKNGQFTVNIALISDKKPVLGVIFIPVTNCVYWAEIGKGAYKDGSKIFNLSKRQNLIASDSIFHSSAETVAFLEQNHISEVKRFGSSIKFCKLAEGEIDIYPRFNGSKEWDTAAGQIILYESGCKIIDLTTRLNLTYNKPSIKNNYFIALRDDLEVHCESNHISCRPGH
jgi:3'(2'), 5'-bisphosphate nucleotidase